MPLPACSPTSMRLHIFSIVPLRESKTPPLFASLISMRTLLGFAMVMASHSLMTTPSPGSSLREPLIPLRNILSRPGGCCAAKAMAISYRRNLNRFPGSIAENRRTGQRQSRKSPRKRGMLFPFEWSDCFLTVSFVKSFQFSQLLSKNLDIFSTFYRIR